jgi:hypothetical protein
LNAASQITAAPNADSDSTLSIARYEQPSLRRSLFDGATSVVPYLASERLEASLRAC